MTEILHNTCAELDKIVTSPYSVSLKSLHALLVQHGSASVHQWAAQCPHHIYRLAAEVVAGLELWPYVLDLVKILATVKSIRNAILCTSPSLLNYLLAKCTSSKEGMEKYSSTCIVLLSDSLPESIPLPALAQTLLLQIFDKAVETPSSQSVRPVYLLLDGACSKLPSILARDTLAGFQDNLTQMMRSVRTLEEQSLSLYCLAVIAQLSRGESVEKSGSSLVGPKACRPQETTFVSFLGAKAHKTIHLLLLQVLFSCRKSESSSGESALIRIQLAREALLAIDQSVLADWTLANGQLVRKLHEKLIISDLPPDISLELYAFAITLSPAMPLGSSAVLRLEKILLNINYHLLSLGNLETGLAIILPSVLPHLSALFFQNLLATCIGYFLQPSLFLTDGAENLTILTTSIRKFLHNHRESQETLLKTIATAEVSKLIRSWLGVNSEVGSVNQIASRGGISRSHPIRVLESQVGLLILEAGLGINLDGSEEVCSIFLSLLDNMTKNNLQTQQNHKIASKSLCILEELCTPEEDGASYHWRDKLAIELQREARSRQEMVHRLVGQLCQDFEARCNDVEEPLRREQMKYEKLAQDHDSLKQRYYELEKQLMVQEKHGEELDKKIIMLETELASAHREVEDVTKQKSAIQEAFDRAQSDAAGVLAATRRDLESQKLDLRTTLAYNVEKIDDQEAEIALLRRKIESIHVASEVQLKEAAQVRQTVEESLRETELKFAHEQMENSHKTQGIQRLEMREISLVDELRTSKQQMDDANAEINEMRSKHADVEKFWEEEKNRLHLQFEQQTKQQHAEWCGMRQDLENVISARERNMMDVQQKYDEDIENRENTIQVLRRKLQKHKTELIHKASELAEAQKLKTRLLTAMGLANSETALPLDLELLPAEENQGTKPTRGGIPNSLTVRARTINDFNDSFHEDTDAETSQSPSASSTASYGGPSPKRAKPRSLHTSFKIPTMDQRDSGSHQISGAIRKRLSTSRKPLADVTNNSHLFKPVVSGKPDSRRASTVPFGQHTKNHLVTDDERLATGLRDLGKSRHASPTKDGSGDTWNDIRSTYADGYDGLNTADFDCTTVEMANIQ